MMGFEQFLQELEREMKRVATWAGSLGVTCLVLFVVAGASPSLKDLALKAADGVNIETMEPISPAIQHLVAKVEVVLQGAHLVTTIVFILAIMLAVFLGIFNRGKKRTWWIITAIIVVPLLVRFSIELLKDCSSFLVCVLVASVTEPCRSPALGFGLLLFTMALTMATVFTWTSMLGLEKLVTNKTLRWHLTKLGRRAVAKLPEDKRAETKMPSVYLGEVHNQDGSPKVLVDDMVLPWNGLVQGTAVFGTVGAGKTPGVLNPALKQLIEHPSKPGGVVFGAKGDFGKTVRDMAEACGRGGDVVIIEPTGQPVYNPLEDLIHGDTPFTIANALMAAIRMTSNADENPENDFYFQQAEVYLRNVLQLLRLANRGENLLSISDVYTVASDSTGEAFQKLLQRAMSQPELPPGEIGVKAWITEYLKTPEPTRIGIESELVRGLHLAGISPLRESFCFRTSGSHGKPVLTSIAAVFNQGKIVVIEMPLTKWGSPSRLINYLVKAAFTTAVSRRFSMENKEAVVDYFATLFPNVDRVSKYHAYKNGPSKHFFETAHTIWQELNAAVEADLQTTSGILAGPDFAGRTQLLNTTRPVFLVMDDYPEVATPNDIFFLDKCRRGNCAVFTAMQNEQQLQKHMSQTDAEAIIISLQNKLWLRLSSEDTADHASELCGEAPYSIVESTVTPLGGLACSLDIQAVQKQCPIFQPSDFTKLLPFQAIFRGTDGSDNLGPTVVYLPRFWEVTKGLKRSWFDWWDERQSR
jgi:hypothetical protein